MSVEMSPLRCIEPLVNRTGDAIEHDGEGAGPPGEGHCLRPDRVGCGGMSAGRQRQGEDFRAGYREAIEPEISVRPLRCGEIGRASGIRHPSAGRAVAAMRDFRKPRRVAKFSLHPSN